MKYYLIAGEASGDMHGANLMKGILKADPKAEFRFWGGDKMAAVGGSENLARHYNTTSFFGIVEVARHLPEIFRQMKECRNDIKNFVPDLLILIDYPGFNLKIARFAHKIGIRTYYYIAPKVWAWNESRVKLIKRYIDRLFIIFPFETEYFRKKGVEAIFEGNPLVDILKEETDKMPSREEFFRMNGIPTDKPLVALLAGSRRSELKYNLPFMAELARLFPDYTFVVGGVKWIDKSVYESIIRDAPVKYICDQTYPLVRYADAAVVTSGTATLETALLGTPEVVCYSKDKISMNIGKYLVKVPFISLVNLVMGREVVRELIQWNMTLPNAENELTAIMPGGVKRQTMADDFAELQKIIGGPGASDRFGARMVELLKKDMN